jgi:hypothetical protein
MNRQPHEWLMNDCQCPEWPQAHDQWHEVYRVTCEDVEQDHVTVLKEVQCPQCHLYGTVKIETSDCHE